MEISELEFVIGFGLLLIIVLVVFVTFFLITAYKRKVNHKQHILKLEFEKQQELLQTQLEIQEQTLKKISQEIHDNIGQELSLAKLNLNTIPAIKDEAIQQKIFNSKELVSKVITDLRNLSHSLDTDYVKEMGLQRAIEYELELINKTGAIETNLIVDGSLVHFEKQKELILFRIVQESFNNIIKHAGAKNIYVNMNYGPSIFTLIIRDDGKGFDLYPLNTGKDTNLGLGLRNMHSRANLIGATFNMSSVISEGTEVKIVLPI